MVKQSWERQREALARLTRVLVEERRGGVMGEALDHLLLAMDLLAGAAYAASQTSRELELELVAERRLSNPQYDDAPPTDAVRRALFAIATQAAETRALVLIPELREYAEANVTGTNELATRGLHSAVAAPVVHQRRTLGVLVLLARDAAKLDGAAMSSLQIGTHIVALATERDRRADRELAHRSELAEAARMASLGLVTATVAHELRTPFDALLVQLEEQQQLLARIAPATTDQEGVREMTELLGEMRAATAQIGAFLGQLTNVSRGQAPRERFDMRDIAQEAVTLVGLELQRRGIRLLERYSPGCMATGDRSSLIQVVTNLVFYAADACASSARKDPTIVLRTWTEESRVILSVEDTGPGIPDSEIPHIFEPFAPQKRKSSYAGLALKVCSHVVSAHHGHIEVLNTDNGASLRVLLPRVIEPERASPTSPGCAAMGTPRTEAVAGAQKVFLVDDDELFSRSIRRALRPHDVRCVATASEAEIALLDPKYVPRLVLCDLVLPGFGGDVLHARVKAKRPEIAERFVFVTGGACTKAEADYVRSSGCPTLLKPIDTKQIMDALELASPSSSAVPEPVPTLRSEAPARNPSGLPTVPPPEPDA